VAEVLTCISAIFLSYHKKCSLHLPWRKGTDSKFLNRPGWCSSNPSRLCSGGALFESRPGHRLSCHVFLVFLSPSG
jgi:hypothetical protein